MTEVRVPTLGESVTEATVATWFKKPGDTVAVDEMLCELETDKVTVEVPSPVAGTLSEVVAAEGETVGVDALLANISEGDAGTDAAPKAKEAAKADDTASEAPREEGGASVDVMVPTLGESVTEATVSTWFKKVGDTVAQDEMLCELETDKVSVEVPAPAAGVLSEILAEEGSTVEASAKLAVISSGAGAAASAPAQENAPAPAAASTGTGKDVEDAPSAKKAMAEAGINRDAVTGTGRDGRVMKEDVAKAIAAGTTAAAPAAAAKPRAPSAADDAAREERVKMTRLKQTMARRLKEAQNTAAILTTFNEVDMTEVMAIRNTYKADFEKKHGVRMGFMSFFTKACCHALKEIPEVNAEIDGTDVIYKNYVHMGVAAGTPTGLVVPVIRDVDTMSFAGIEKAIGDMGKKARDGKLTMADMTGGTFTISNGGVYGSLMTAPILNPPQSGILGMAKIQDRAMVIGGEIVIRPMMYISLSYDHRIIDGKGAVTFLVRVKEMLEDPRRLLMDL
ncbi:2-oxoglutarate dehydrogenase complex dihydrolipoyllysine-residue succinyltransferase [Sulfitobacter geojensis]|jgi:2-oxoglutarate dehydrogenase E2 component (dihydrolipoamide succinyltransferase)|uniref:Dihydrolipoyllysine-residue succinyltransferase component of 2-oxoglutarate dehydrogenase complex n=1 Tax=Sulfitobacter geojensis TaxID=1342299 RepID=A0AAE2VY00_9RHOB|nr:2-oxoglutarate dehydrogenase complex dihydrolipoyllysine-residue succinyltransferase [Sulfitobacter geojensis]MBM1689128.1 2-oxoglutarate dehydrogenase complex dihydrolipoyllysine-residue succinyltransferase [Sulfitobacter geojensis]MBM1693195.1 2-oxoglutarate dehydrogenase complex dihydrolipoyllysine-residue succinyltransferase [Sulfitobacter geojensis]MBM1705361.1 2-oxoglutarate dehydrogenase complex dihydrolipoyllysine-residue succinyltransferase [Sulfitobacter geojensis]MBM1709419.1 2-ox